MSVNFHDLLHYKMLRRRGLSAEEAADAMIVLKQHEVIEKANKVKQQLLTAMEELRPPQEVVQMNFLAPDQKLITALSSSVSKLQLEQQTLKEAVEERKETLAAQSVKKVELSRQVEELKQMLANPPLHPNIKNIYLAAEGNKKKGHL